MLGEANLVERSRVITEKPFGTDLASAVSLNADLHKVFSEQQSWMRERSSAPRTA